MEWIRETQWLWWIAAALALGLVEVASLDLVFLMLAVAAVAAAGAAWFGGGITVQVLTFVAVAALLLAVLRPLALRRLKPAGEGGRTNADALVGRTAHVLQEVTDRAGLVKLVGEEWTARAAHGVVLPVDEDVQVLRIDGATAIVAALRPDSQTQTPPPAQPDRPADGTTPHTES